ncbi:hypothetical protein EVAR_3990_1 [Eumeta japonica]|uniref:Uncharacterized protein n=1 Tax=Eumeta variegata TaxID=151549 RepID=A0A4C1T3U9_EUMVA|nr:hypothetical protein EVAR_3990_1 [Eumeta japonica]
MQTNYVHMQLPLTRRVRYRDATSATSQRLQPPPPPAVNRVLNRTRYPIYIGRREANAERAAACSACYIL